MAIEYLGLSEINGPMIVVEGVEGAFYDEIVEFSVGKQAAPGMPGAGSCAGAEQKKLGRIVEISGDKAVIQVFESTAEMSLLNTRTRLTGHPMEIGLSEDILGRTLSGLGRPIDGLGPVGRGIPGCERAADEPLYQGVSAQLYPHRDFRD